MASMTVSGMISKTMGLAIREFLDILTGINDTSPVVLLSFTRKSSSVKIICTSIDKKGLDINFN